MTKAARNKINEWVSGSVVWILLTVSLLIPSNLIASDATRTSFAIRVNFDNRLLNEVEVNLHCPTGIPEHQRIPVTSSRDIMLVVESFPDGAASCQLQTSVPFGYTIAYSGRGEAVFKADHNGCVYGKISDGHSNDCQIDISQDSVRITTYKKWIGGTGEETDIRIRLDCESGNYTGSRYVNEGLPAGWDISQIDPDGVVCSVFEAPGDSYVADEFDCQSLVIFPGKGEECTMVNTKIVKRIEMLNRYGKAIMILVMLVAGLIGMKRYT